MPSNRRPVIDKRLLLKMDVFEIRRRRVRQLITDDFGSVDARFAEKVGKAATVVYRWFTDKPEHQRNIGEKLARQIEAACGKPAKWLDQEVVDATTTIGVSVPPRADANHLNQDRRHYAVNDNDYVEIPVLNDMLGVSAGASAGRNALPEIQNQAVDRYAYRLDWICENDYSVEALRVVRVKGDSMVPYVFDGNRVLINTAQKRVIDGEHYGVRIGTEPKIKRLFTQSDGRIRLESYNAPADFIVPSYDAEVLGLVVDRTGASWIPR